MASSSWWRTLFSRSQARRAATRPNSLRKWNRARLALNHLEGRLAPAANLLADINTVPDIVSSSSPNTATVVGDTTYFIANDGIHGSELWATDGTAAGTRLLKDIAPGIAGSVIGSELFFTVVGSKVYFSADDGVHGLELWCTDGTTAGTFMVADINPGSASSNPIGFAQLAGRVVFSADDPDHGTGLWTTDGTPAGTTLLVNSVPNSSPAFVISTPAPRPVIGSYLYFLRSESLSHQLWRTDGTPAGTTVVASNLPNLWVFEFRVFGSTLYMLFGDSPGDYTLDYELWTSDGTNAGTARIAVSPMSAPYDRSYEPNHFTAVGSQVFFEAWDPEHGRELWITDGTQSGTRIASETVAGPGSTLGSSGFYGAAFAYGDRLLYLRSGPGIFVTDGTPAGTGLFAGAQLAVQDILTVVGSTVYFRADDGVHGSELWQTDGTAEGTVLVEDINPGLDGSYPVFLAANGSSLYFAADDGIHGRELWVVTPDGITGTAGNDTITIDPGTQPGTVKVTVNGTVTDNLAAGPIQIDGLGGSDTYIVNFGSPAPTVILADTGTDGSDTLTVNGTAQGDTLLKNAGTIQWRLTGDTVYRQQLDFDGMEGVTLNAAAGNDTIIDPNSGNFLILGGPGDDTITVADTTGPVIVDGGDGSDTCIIQAGNLQGPVSVTDTGTTGTNSVSVVGTPGTDTFTQSGDQLTANGATITLGTGVNSLTLDGGGGTGDTVTVVGTPSIPPTIGGGFDTDVVVDGTAGNDLIRVTPGTHPGEVKVRVNGVLIGTYLPTGKIVVNGGDGNDDIEVAPGVLVPAWLYGGAGCDELRAGGGTDRLFGEGGNDKLFARHGDDELDGGADDDELRAGTGSDIVHGGDGCDELWGGTGDDMLYGDAGDDILRGGGGSDRLEGGAGNDELRAGTGGDTLLGGDGNDTMKGGQGGDWMEGGAGNDRLDGMAGDDVLLGGVGDDLLMGGAGRDFMIGGTGADRIEGNADEDILVAGFTLFDGNRNALQAIHAEWTSGNSYATRVANITGGTGLTQGFRLWGTDGALQTVFNDTDHDVLAGGAGIDWFFANLNGGGTLDTISDLRANELWSDTDF